jgi:hypothetical protein
VPMLLSSTPAHANAGGVKHGFLARPGTPTGRDRRPLGDADAIAHFHVSHLVCLREVLPGDGYLRLTKCKTASLDGLLNTLGSWTEGTIRVVPALGKVSDGEQVKAHYDMIATLEDRVQAQDWQERKRGPGNADDFVHVRTDRWRGRSKQTGSSRPIAAYSVVP